MTKEFPTNKDIPFNEIGFQFKINTMNIIIDRESDIIVLKQNSIVPQALTIA